MQRPHRITIYSGHAVIALAICGAVIVALFATPDVAVPIVSALLKMAEAAASTVKP